jgi:hypothetical protein
MPPPGRVERQRKPDCEHHRRGVRAASQPLKALGAGRRRWIDRAAVVNGKEQDAAERHQADCDDQRVGGALQD